MLMFDAGEGIQIALKRGGFGIRGLDAVAISHLHADHTLGIPGMMMFRAQNDDPGPLTLIGPPGLKRFVDNTIEVLGCHINYEYTVIEWTPSAQEVAWSWNGTRLLWTPLDHSTFCLGYRLEENTRPGRFNLDKAAALGVPKGRMFSLLQSGQPVTLDGGQIVHPSEVLGPPRPGRTMAFATDTRPCPGLSRVLHNADLVFVEGMFALEHQEDAREKKHMTACEAATAVKHAGAKRAILVHISPRYTVADETVLENEAKSICPAVEMSKPLAVYSIPLSE
jgi:ribonuclease Z